MNDEEKPEEDELHDEDSLDIDMDLDIDLDEDDDDEDELDLDLDKEEEEEEEEIGAPQEEAPADAPPAEPIQATIEQDVAIKVQEVPLHVVVEAGRLKMSLQQLLDLQPGNLLELGITPESGVNLTVAGKVIGRGELIRVGEALGVRILEKG